MMLILALCLLRWPVKVLYKNDRDAKRREGLSQMTKKSQKLLLYTKVANTLEDHQTLSE
jgi:ribosomal protein S15P/S13E